MVEELVRYHGASASEAGRRLAFELMCEGYNVTSDFVRLGVGPPWVYSARMEEFYSKTDGFLFELLSWHHRPSRLRWRREISKRIAGAYPDGARVLSLGDGVGFDSLEICKACPGTFVTRFEFDNASSRFAQRRLDHESIDVRRRLTHLRDLHSIPRDAFDIVVCLDVLEHVPEPLSVVQNIHTYLRTSGEAIISEAFGEVRPFKPTHLAANLRYAGKTISMFRRAGFRYDETFCGRVYRFKKDAAQARGNVLDGAKESLRLRAIGVLARLQFYKSFRSRDIDLEMLVREATPGADE
jgi:SAM-dependent methyltransferase